MKQAYKIFIGITYSLYYQFCVKHTHENRVKVLIDWMNDPEHYNEVFDSMNDSNLAVEYYISSLTRFH